MAREYVQRWDNIILFITRDILDHHALCYNENNKNDDDMMNRKECKRKE